jgi:hypothetical protein
MTRVVTVFAGLRSRRTRANVVGTLALCIVLAPIPAAGIAAWPQRRDLQDRYLRGDQDRVHS